MELADLPLFLPSAGVFGLFTAGAWFLIHVMRQASSDRSSYEDDRRELRQQYAAEIQELRARHDEQIAGLRNDISVLRAEVSDLRQQIEEERKARWIAEDAAARFRRMIDGDNAAEGEPHEPPPAT